MAITSSAKKAIRASAKKRIYNIRRKDALSGATKAFMKALTAADVKGATKLLPAAYQAIDKASKTNVISKNTGNRKKARLAAALAKVEKK